jgi:hypothetical protein
MGAHAFLGVSAWIALAVLLAMPKSAGAQGHYDYWPLFPSIMLVFETGEPLVGDTLTFGPSIEECNHALSY